MIKIEEVENPKFEMVVYHEGGKTYVEHEGKKTELLHFQFQINIDPDRISTISFAGESVPFKMKTDKVYAIKVRNIWHLAKILPIESYGERTRKDFGFAPGTKVWAELNTTAYLGRVGSEDAKVVLEDKK